MKFVYLDKRDRVRLWFSPSRSLGMAGAMLVFLLLPIWHQSTTGRFTLEPAKRAVVRATVPGMVRNVYAREGEPVTEGTALFKLSNLPLDSRLARSRAEYAVATERASAASLKYQDLGYALQERSRSFEQTRALLAEAKNLDITSPLSGVVLTADMENQLGSYVTEGTELAEIGDLRQMRARLYISEYDLYKLRVGARVRLQVDGLWEKWDTSAVAIAPLSTEIDPALGEENKYKGLNPSTFYVVEIVLENGQGHLKPGMTGVARVYGRRRSFGGLSWEAVANFFSRKMW